jgi:processive 1,2-diacylglycerol beta-glucosyltransferase
MARIITFSTNISAGHKRAAEAVARAILAASADSRIVDRDSMMLIGRRRRKLLSRTYLGIIRHKPALWNYLYGNEAFTSGIDRLSRWFIGRSTERFAREIEEHDPEVVICTQAIPSRVIGDLKLQGRCRAPILAVATDYGIHPYWPHPAIEAYAVPCDEAKAGLIEVGIAREKIHVTGIPVDEAFERPPTQASARAALDLPEEGRFALVMGGGNGLGVSAELVARLETVPALDGVLVIAGCNRKLEEEVRALPDAGKLRRVYGTVEGIERHYAAVDLLVSKPGGLTMSEATALGLPIVMIAPLPGQEVRNAEFLAHRGAAVMAEDGAALVAIVSSILADPLRRRRLAAASASVGRSGAAARIAEIALRLAAMGSSSIPILREAI